MSWFITILFVALTFGHLSDARHVNSKRLNSAVIVGKVYCDTCFREDFHTTSHFISGALVAVECRYGAGSRPVFREEAKTDRHGEFRVQLPFSVSKHVKRIERCSVELISSSEPYCAVASAAASSSALRRRHGTRVFSAGFFTFKPQNQPTLCNQKPSLPNPHQLLDQNPNLAFPPPLKDPNMPGDLPPLPSLPIPNIPIPNIPNLPNLPPLPKLPLLPSLPGNLPPLISTAEKTKLTSKPLSLPKPHHGSENGKRVDTQHFFLPPNPFQPPPLIPNPFQPPPLIPNPFQPPPLIPNPFQPPPAPLIPNPLQPPPAPLIPNPLQPPPAPAPFFNLPPIPGLTPSPPPPAPVFPPFPFPPFPFNPPRSPAAPPGR